MTSMLRKVTEGKIDSWNCVGAKYGIEPAMFYKMLIFKAENRLRSHVLPPPFRESIP
jgi:hypothetical protein